MPEGESLLRLALVAVTGIAFALLRALRRARQAANVSSSEARDSKAEFHSPDLSRRAVAVAHAKTTAILNATDEAILLCNKQGLVTELNNRGVEIFGHKHAEAVGKSASALLFPSPMNMIFQSALDRFLEGDAPLTDATETTACHQNGSRFSVQFTIARLELDNAGFALCIRDIDSEKKAQLELERTLRQTKKTQHELEQFARFATNRELNMVALKEEINELLAQQGVSKKYSIPDASSPDLVNETATVPSTTNREFSAPSPDWEM